MRAATIVEYIQAAPLAGQPHLLRLHDILKSVAPDAEETIKWGNPFFVEPRFLFAFSAHKAHLSFAPTAAMLSVFRKELKDHKTTKNFLQVPYDEPQPEELIRKIARHCVQTVSGRHDDDNESTPATDGILYLRHLLGFRDMALTTGALGAYADRTVGADIATYLATPRATHHNCSANIVGAPGGPNAMLDGIVLMRAMLGLTGIAVTNGISFPAGTTRTTWVDIKAHLNTNCGMALN